MSTNSLLLSPVGCSTITPAPRTKIDVPGAMVAAFDLLWNGESLVAAPQGPDGPAGSRIALLAVRREAGETVWYLAAGCGELGVNGISPPLPVMRLEPGALLSVGDRFWMVSVLWQPAAVDAPDELRDKSCPVCGGELQVAPVVQCVCGRWMHLERPEEPSDPNALNCYLVSDTCGNCGRPTSLSPQVLPEISERLLPPTDEDDWFPAELSGQEALA
jgi:hypothetical protein